MKPKNEIIDLVIKDIENKEIYIDMFNQSVDKNVQREDRKKCYKSMFLKFYENQIGVLRDLLILSR